MVPAPRPPTREDQRPTHVQIEEGEKRVETLSLACGKSREHGQATQPPRWVLRQRVHLCRDMTARLHFFLRGNQ